MREYLFDERIMSGLQLTLELTVVVMVMATAIGLVVALMLMSKNFVLRSWALAFLWVMRAVPTLVQLIFWYNLAALYPTISIGIPFGPTFATASANSLITTWTAAVIGLSLHEAAYMAEIVRSGIQAVDRGQTEAGLALGMSKRRTMRRIILPQAFRMIIPPTVNQVIMTLKVTSLVSVIALSDLLHSAQLISARNFEVIPLLVVVVFWYLVCTSTIMFIQFRIERKLSVHTPSGPRNRYNKLAREYLERTKSRAPFGSSRA